MKKPIIIGENFVRQDLVVLGNDGASHKMNPDGTLSENIDHTGGILIGDDVEIQTGTVIQRATRDFTSIEHGTKVGPLVLIGHNCEIGNYNFITAGCIFGGSAKTGDHVWVGFNATIRNHVYIVHHTVIGMGAVVINDILEPYGVWVGNPARFLRKWDGKTQPF